MASDTFYKKCCAEGLGYCAGAVQWHHTFIYGGRQINEVWAIVPACERHHDQVQKEPKVKMFFEKVSLARATETDLKKYPRKNWTVLKLI